MSNKPSHRGVPRLPEWILRRMTAFHRHHSILEDFEDTFEDIRQTDGTGKARRWYWIQALRSVPEYIRFIIVWRIVMLTSYLKIALRNIKKNKIYSFINITGLAAGMAVCILILLWIQDELGFDRFHRNGDRIHRVITETRKENGDLRRWAISAWPLGAALVDEYPEVAGFTRFRGLGRSLITYKNKRMYEESIFLADPSFLDIFSFPIVRGDPDNALAEAHTCVISEKTAEKYFGRQNPIGQTITLNNRIDYSVTAVIEIPGSSHLRFDFLLPLEKTLKNSPMKGNWGSYDVHTFIMLKENVSVEDFKNKIHDFPIKRSPETTSRLKLQALTDMHLHSDFAIDLYGTSRDTSIYIYIFSIIAVLILLIACVNFINLTMARSSTRTREIGLRKVMGAVKKDLITQFFGESAFLATISWVVALIFVRLLLPLFNDLAGKELALNPFGRTNEGLYLILVAVFTGIVAGIFPALIQSSFQPTHILKGHYGSASSKPGRSLLQKGLVVFQFTCSVALIIGTLIISRQFGYIQAKDLGYEKDRILYFRQRGEIAKQFDAFRAELLKHPDVVSVTTSSDVPTHTEHATIGVDWEGKAADTKFLIHHFSVDPDYLKTMNMEIVTGRDFSRAFTADTQGKSFILNEAAVEAMNLKHPVGQWFKFWDKKGTVIGVVKNFHFKSLHKKVEPLVFRIDPSWHWLTHVKVRGENMPGTLEHIKKIYLEFNPNYPFEYLFLDRQLDRLYDGDRRTYKIFQAFTLIAIVISCLGLFGLAAYTARRRTKEIGIRKVVGATMPNIIRMLSKEFLLLVAAANILAWPLAYFTMSQWLESFVYRTDMGWGTFVFSALLAFSIALSTVIYQSVKASRTNPVDALRCE